MLTFLSDYLVITILAILIILFFPPLDLRDRIPLEAHWPPEGWRDEPPTWCWTRLTGCYICVLSLRSGRLLSKYWWQWAVSFLPTTAFSRLAIFSRLVIVMTTIWWNYLLKCKTNFCNIDICIFVQIVDVPLSWSPWRRTTSPFPRPPLETTWSSTSRTSLIRTSREDVLSVLKDMPHYATPHCLEGEIF